jgi:hypothetical protein
MNSVPVHHHNFSDFAKRHAAQKTKQSNLSLPCSCSHKLLFLSVEHTVMNTTSPRQALLLNTPSMIMRPSGASSYRMDNRHHSVNKMNPLEHHLQHAMNMNTLGGMRGSAAQAMVGARLGAQFPPQRLPSTFAATTSHGGGFPLPGQAQRSKLTSQQLLQHQLPLSLLCDVASGHEVDAGGAKRAAADAPGSSNKRFKTDYLLKPSPIKDTPMLLDRISSLGGGFPMPKWSGFVKAKSHAAQVQPIPLEVTFKLKGGFPMPRLQEGKDIDTSATLTSFRNLWSSTDRELRQEILARKLQRGNVILVR